MPPFLALRNILPEIFNSPFTKPIDWQINHGEVWTVIGPNGSGKSLLAEIICGNLLLLEGSIYYSFLKEQNENPDQFVKTLKFDSVFSMADYRNAYYQLRFNNPEEDIAPLVSKLFPATQNDNPELNRIFELLDIHKLIDRRLIQLSSGELRKFLIARILLEKPQVLIFDNPFIGLDTASREHLNDIFPRLIASGMHIIFLVPSGSELPAGTTHILEMTQGEIVSKSPLQNYQLQKKPTSNHLKFSIDWNKLPSYTETECDILVQMENIEISYGNKVICKDINWIVKKGEKWALLGPNGSGKSTLLSYICADNPRSYVEGLTLFENKRGSGESIWEIKRRIGFTSSEMHLYYRKKATCLQVLESGLFDSVGLYHTTFGEERQIAEYLMDCLSIGQLKNKLFSESSSGEQKMILFARAIIKNPELLVLDEPFHGLDSVNKEICEKLLDFFCSQPGKTLIFVTHLKDEIPNCVDKFFELSLNFN
jgi:molybdate transport system ATP-binding protein